jgi:superfamily II DNA or RNA helicase
MSTSSPRKSSTKLRSIRSASGSAVGAAPFGSSQKQRSCINRSKVPLRDVQRAVVKYMNNHDSLLVVHTTGCGKTLTAITVSQCYLDSYPENRVIFIGPTSLLSNFTKEMEKYGVENYNKYELYSYTQFLLNFKKGKRVDTKNSLLILDEVHNIRNLQDGQKQSKGSLVVESSYKAHKKLLLTATPFVNSVKDFIPYVNILHGEKVLGSSKDYNNGITNYYVEPKKDDPVHDYETLYTLLYGRVHFFDCRDIANYPTYKIYKIDVPMSESYYKNYERVLKKQDAEEIFSNPRAFYNGYRRAVNMAGPEYFSDKINYILPIIEKGKTIIYTNWIDFGIKPIEATLKKNNISFRSFTGSTKTSIRTTLVQDFNAGVFNVLILARAGGEGLDLKGVRNVVVMDPPWNDSGIQQITGRAIRFQSHNHLPKEERHVDVYFLSLVTPPTLNRNFYEFWKPKTDILKSGDALLYNIIATKAETNKRVIDLLKKCSFDYNP